MAEVFVVTDADRDVEQIVLRQRVAGVELQQRPQDEVVFRIRFRNVDIVVPVDAQRRRDQQPEIPGFHGVKARLLLHPPGLCRDLARQ